jgi:hypothetical protein
MGSERRGVTVAVVPFSGRAGEGGTRTITLSRLDVEEAHRRVVTNRPSGSRARCDRYGEFAGLPWIRSAVTWTLVARPPVRTQSMSAATDGHEQDLAV